MSLDKTYVITNLDGYANKMIQSVLEALGEKLEDIQDHDKYITLEQMKGIINENSIGFDLEHRPFLNINSSEKIFEATVVWVKNTILARLAAKDLVECAWDDEKNDWVFWYKEDKEKGEI
jgi:hypothetical protein